VNWNLGLPGKSNDYINRMITCTKEKLNPTIVLVSFTRLLRREWVDKNGVFFDYLPDQDNVTSPHFKFLSNNNQNILNFYLNYKSIEANLKDVNFMFTFCFDHNKCLSDVLNIVDKNKYVGYFSKVDRAGDNIHRGETSHYNLAESFFKKYNDKSHNSKSVEDNGWTSYL